MSVATGRRPDRLLRGWGVSARCIALLISAACNSDSEDLSRPDGASDAEWGEQLYFKLRCATCHDTRGQRRTGPPLNGRFGSDVTLAGGSATHFDAAYFARAVLEPDAELVQGYPAQMPSYKGVLSDEHLAALKAYLRTLD